MNLTYHEIKYQWKNKLDQSDLPVKKKYPNYHPKIPYFEKVLFGIFLLTGMLGWADDDFSIFIFIFGSLDASVLLFQKSHDYEGVPFKFSNNSVSINLSKSPNIQ